MTAVLTQISQKAWIWSFIGAFLVWLATTLYIGGAGGAAVLATALSFATFTVIVGIGQMFVITTGPGNVDLSIPATISFSGAVAMKIMDGSNAMLPVGIAVSLACGFVVGLFNYMLIRILRIPPIVATLSSSFLVLSTAIAYGRGLKIKPPSMLADFATARIFGIPVLAVVFILFAVLMSVVLNRTLYGRSVLAIGQNQRAAWLAGIQVERIRLITYVLSAVLAAVCGFLLSGFSGGASLNMGQEYLLASIAVVVIGGTSVAGGKSNVPGIWGAAMFMFLLVTMLNTFGASAGVRLILTGLIIVAVITIAGGDKPQR
ncbi:MAG: ABC transporter permease [Pseudomonadota bacterium]